MLDQQESAVKAPVLAEGKVSFASAKRPANAHKVREMAKEIKPTMLPTMSEAMEAGRDSGSSVIEEISEAENFDSVSFTSSIFRAWKDSFNARNVTLPSGRLDVEKLMSWSLPLVNLSKVLQRSTCKSPGTRSKIKRLIAAQKDSRRPDHPTPAIGSIFIQRQRGRKARKSSMAAREPEGPKSEKESIRKMLQNSVMQCVCILDGLRFNSYICCFEVGFS